MAKYTDTVAGHAGVALLMSPAVQLIPKWHNGLSVGSIMELVKRQ